MIPQHGKILFSSEMYRELFKPAYQKMAKLANDRGLPIETHNCGRCEDFIDDWIDLGVVSWNPAQTSKDLLAIKKKYGNKMVINGGWDIVGELTEPNVSEVTMKEAVCDTIDKYATGEAMHFAAHS